MKVLVIRQFWINYKALNADKFFDEQYFYE